MSKKNFLSTAGSIKGMGEAPNLRACAARQCSSCNFFQSIEGDWENGRCAKHDFQSKHYLVCDDWTEIPAQPLEVVVVDASANAPSDLSTDNPSTDTGDAPAMLSVPRYVKSLHLSHDEQFMKDVLAAKFIGKDDIKSYTNLWGDPNLVDLETEFFTGRKSALGATDFWDASLGTPRPLTWNHAQDPDTFKAPPIVGKMVEFGDDDVGRWYHAVLDRSHAYRRAIDAHISQRNLGTSSDSAPQYVERVKTKNGAVWLKTWPLFAAALTDVPCEPRMIDVGSVNWKSVADFLKTAGVDVSTMQQQSAEASQAAARAMFEQQMEFNKRQIELLKMRAAVL